MDAKICSLSGNLATENTFIYLRASYLYDQKDFAKRKKHKVRNVSKVSESFFANSAAIVFEEKKSVSHESHPTIARLLSDEKLSNWRKEKVREPLNDFFRRLFVPF